MQHATAAEDAVALLPAATVAGSEAVPDALAMRAADAPGADDSDACVTGMAQIDLADVAQHRRAAHRSPSASPRPDADAHGSRNSRNHYRHIDTERCDSSVELKELSASPAASPAPTIASPLHWRRTACARLCGADRTPEQRMRRRWRMKRIARLLAGPALALSLMFVPLTSSASASSAPSRCLALTVWMSTWWVFEVFPVAVVSLMPLVLAPLLGLLSARDVALTYFNDNSFLLFGSFVLSAAIQKHALHRRISLKILTWTRGRPRVILLGFMCVSAFLSMWMSNTATASMLVPVAVSATMAMPEDAASMRFRKALMLGVAYCISIGSVSTLMGTSTNLVFTGQLQLLFPAREPIDFIQWMSFSLPIALSFVIVVWLIFSIGYVATPWCGRRCGRAAAGHGVAATVTTTTVADAAPAPCVLRRLDAGTFRREYAALGPWTTPQYRVCAAFAAVIVLWLTRNLPNMPGWSALFRSYSASFQDYVSDGTVAMTVALALFICPSGEAPPPLRPPSLDPVTVPADDAATPQERAERESPPPAGARASQTLLAAAEAGTLEVGPGYMPIIEWKQCAASISWDVLLLLGGGFALAECFRQSGLTAIIGDALKNLAALPRYLSLTILCLATALLTEFTSNMATASIILPIVASFAVAVRINPLFFMVPCTVTCSFAFMSPVGTPPNAIVYGSGAVRMRDMMKVGVFLNAIGVALVVLWTAVLGNAVYDMSTFPAWAAP